MSREPRPGASCPDDADGSARAEPLSTLLITQPQTTDLGRDACIDALTVHPPTLANLIAITHEQAPDEWLATWRQRIGDSPANLTLITADATTRSAAQPVPPSQETAIGGQEVLALSDPGDLTQLGIIVSERLTDWQDTDRRPVVCGGSLTAMLQWVDLPVLFRFLHVFLQRLRAADALIHFHLHPDAHSDQTRQTLEQLFDRVIDEPLNRPREQPTALDTDALFDLLCVPRRRHVLRILLDEGVMPMDNLAARVVAHESTAAADEYSDHTRDRMRIDLHHSHLPKLDRAGLIDYDETNHTARLVATETHVESYLNSIDEQP